MDLCLDNTKYKDFIKFCQLVFRTSLATNFLSYTHRHIDAQTDIFQKQSNRVEDIPKRVNPSKTGNRKFARNQYSIQPSIYIEESKKGASTAKYK